MKLQKKLLQVATLLMLSLLAGCANVGAKFNTSEISTPPNNEAVVFFYRPSGVGGSGAAAIQVYANKMEVGKLENGAYFKRTLKSGTYDLHTDTWMAIDEPSTVELESGKVYFARFTPEVGFFIGSIRLIMVNENEAIKEMKETGLQL